MTHEGESTSDDIPKDPEHSTSCQPSVVIPSVTLDPPDTPHRTEQLLNTAPTENPAQGAVAADNPHQGAAAADNPLQGAAAGPPPELKITSPEGTEPAERGVQISNESEEYMTPLVTSEPDPLGMVLAAADKSDFPISIDGELIYACVLLSACLSVCLCDCD